MRKAKRNSESFSSLMLVVFFFVSNTANFFIHSLNKFDLKNKCLCVTVYLQSGALYENIRHDLRSEYSRRKSVRSKHQWS